MLVVIPCSCFLFVESTLFLLVFNQRYIFYLLQVTRDVSLLSRWMAIDLYIREVDNLRFELSMNRCSDTLAKLAQEISLQGLLV